MIGPGHPCFIIAEAGVNHNGDLSQAVSLVRAAKRAGADCVKFQTFSAERIVRDDAPKARYQLQTTDPAESQKAMLKNLELPAGAYPEILRACEEEGILFLSTPYSEEDVDFLDNLGVQAFKCASIHLFEPSFLAYAASKGKPLIVSTGFATLDDVRLAVDALRSAGNEQLILLQCTTNYPSRIEDANLRAMVTMHDATGCLVGYSDHTQTSVACVAAVALGATVLEKHFTLDKTLPGPDQSTSADPLEFAALVAAVREAEAALGSSVKQPCEAERMNAPGMRRSIVAKRAIPKGTTITADMLTFKRPGTGIPPAKLSELLGASAARDIQRDELLSLDQLRLSSDPVIRPLALSDVPSLSALLQGDSDDYRQHFTPFPFDVSSLRQRLASARRDRYWGIWLEGVLVGFFMLRGFDEGYERPAFGIYVAEKMSGRGLARLALDFAERWCARERVPTIMLKVADQNVRARRMYEAAGFLHRGKDPASGQAIFEKRLLPA